MNLTDLAIDALRDAVHKNQVSFPAQVPAFPKLARADLQCKLVQLYFLRGWSSDAIGRRYGVTRQRVRQILLQWRRRAVCLGFIQQIPPAEPLVQLPALAMYAGILHYRTSESVSRPLSA